MAGMHGHGTRLERSDGAGGWVVLADTTTIDPPALSREGIDVSSHRSTDKYMEFIPGMRDGGEVSVDCNWQPAEHDDWVMADYESDDAQTYRIVLPTTTEHAWTYDAFITSYEPSSPYDDKAEASITFKVTGKPDLSELNGGS